MSTQIKKDVNLNIEKLAFLSNPEEYTNDLTQENLFRD